MYPFADKLNTESEVVSTPPIDWDVLLVRGYEEILISVRTIYLKTMTDMGTTPEDFRHYLGCFSKT